MVAERTADGAWRAVDVDFAAIFEAVPTPYLVLSPELVIVGANPAYLASVGRIREELLGRPVFEAFPPTPDALDESGVPRVQLSFERARDTGRPDTMPIQKYDIPDTAGGFVERFWSLISIPVPGPDGSTALIVQRAEDITDFLRERDQRGDDFAWRRRVEQVESDLFARARELAAAVEAKELAGRRLARLAEVALQLTGAETVADLERIVVGRGLPVLGADGGAIVVPDGAGGLRLALSSLGEPALTGYSQLPWDSPLPAPHTARTGERLLLPTRASGLAFSEEMAGVYAATGRSAWVCLPLQVRDELLGSLAVSWVEERTFAPDELELLEGFAAQCAQALERIRATEAERRSAQAARRMSETLQRSLLTSPPHVEGLQVAVRYQPAAQEAQVGGDWYDAFLTAAGPLLLVVGDINGHDRTAAATMGQVRNVLRGIAYDSGTGPADLLRRLDVALHGLGLESLATAVLARVDPHGPDGWRLCWSNAGHPPPLLRSGDGTVRLLDGDNDLLLGLDPDTARGEQSTVLAPGDTLLLYTDGLVERRSASLDEGLARLRDVLAGGRAADPETLCDAVLAALGRDGNDDDIALLALRVDAPSGS